MTKTELLAKIDEKTLRGIAKNENYHIPKNFDKRDLVKYLAGSLTLQKIKEYTAEVYERTTKREIIRETIKEKGIRIKAKETSQVSFNKIDVIRELTKEKINNIVLEELARNLKQPNPSGKGFNLYDSMPDEMLDYLNRVFINKESDGRGLFLEYRTANFIKQKSKIKIENLKIRHHPARRDEIDVTGYNSKNKPVVIAECKDRHVKKEDMAKWLINSIQIFQEFNGSLQESYFVTSDRITDQNYSYVADYKDVDSKEGILKIRGLFSGLLRNLNDDKTVTGSRGLALFVYEVRQNEFVKIFPKK